MRSSPLSHATDSQVLPLLLAHSVTRVLVVTAVFLARCIVEISSLIFPVWREFILNDCMLGMATEISTVATPSVVSNSMSVYPFCLIIGLS